MGIIEPDGILNGSNKNDRSNTNAQAYSGVTLRTAVQVPSEGQSAAMIIQDIGGGLHDYDDDEIEERDFAWWTELEIRFYQPIPERKVKL